MAKILIVDDEKSIRNTLCTFLRNEGYTADAVEDVNSAFALLAQHNYDIIVSDIIMPHISGVELLEYIRREKPSIQVIIMTGEPTVETAVKAVQAGAYDYITKPIVKSTLLKVVGQAVHVRELLEHKQRIEKENRKYQKNLEVLVAERTAKLSESERAMTVLLGNLPGVAYRCLNEYDWPMDFLSEKCFDLTGYKAHELINKSPVSYGQLIHPDDRKVVWEQIQKALKNNDYFEVIYRINKASGQERWIWGKGRGIYDCQGHLKFLEGFLLDITERKQSEDALKMREKVLRKQKTVLLSLMAKGIWYKDNLKSVISEVTEACSELTEAERVSVWWHEEDYTSVKCFDLYTRSTGQHSEGEELISAEFSNYIKSHLQGNVIATEDVNNEIINKDSLYLYHMKDKIISALDTPIWLHGRIGGILCIESVGAKRPWSEEDKRLSITIATLISLCVETAERKRAVEDLHTLNAQLEERVKERTAQLQESNKELEAFTYSVSHDLRAPLRAVTGFSRILLQDYTDKLDAEGNRLLGVVCTNIAHMDKLITDLLELSRNTRTELNYTYVDMTELVQSTYRNVASPDLQKIFEFDLSPLPGTFGDPGLLGQVWQNLLSNAIKYTMPKDRRLIQVGSYTENSKQIYFVKDNGVGFNPKYAHKLFGVFQRLHKQEEFEGSGIGLAIVQRIISRMDGTVWAKGELNEGATFYFSLPTETAQRGEKKC